jgi:hypothetical protein
MAAADPALSRGACLELIASFRALERAARRRRRRPVALNPRRFFMTAFPLFEYLLFEETIADVRGTAPHLMRDVDPHLVLAGRSCWRGDDGQLQIDLQQLAQANDDADSRYYGACFWQAGPLPLYVPATGENRVEACAALGVTIRAQVHPMLVPEPCQLRLRPVRMGGWALELLSPVEGRSIAPEMSIRALPFSAAVPVLRTYGVPTGPPIPGLGLHYKISGLFDRYIESQEADPGQWPPPPIPAQPDLATRCDGTQCLPARPNPTRPDS